MSVMNEVRENRLLARWAELLPRHPGQVGAIQDADAELVPLDDDMLLALTVDSLSEEIEAGLYTAAVAGRVVVAACLSDLAAVGAQPTGLLLSVTLPRAGPDATQAAVAEGAGKACREAGVFVLGGDTGEGDR
ncbi:MAG: thiamine-phosphate kinase, partial [Gammaproteobacteria bacterium]|nr:thiamine-phosphate kinase [Gemmatimonadota bacterium]NIR36815.1 thiamine-phosphate kinase [Actinomycetota bacterium]NIU79634.1 thiamine-phosphate kinase [Gammaproteobacteria bacterium]NIY12646.1 thiamine-phosphate kinase [Gemmatimonadota bacterium]